MTSRFAVAKERALGALDELVHEFFGTGRRSLVVSHGAFYVPSPGSSSTPDQMVIWRTGARRGGWADFVAGEKGDVIDLVAYAKFGGVTKESRIEAVGWLEDRFGIRAMAPDARAKMEEDGRRRREQSAAREADRLNDARERSRKAFFAASPVLLGTPVESYLRHRGIDLNAVPNLSAAFRYRADAEWWMGAERDGEGRKIAAGPKFPALVSAMTSADGKICALHYTFIATDGRGKAPVSKAKLMWPEVAGLEVCVTLGPSGLSCADAAAKAIAGVLGRTEGIEDAFSAGISNPALRMHAAGSLPGLLTVPDQACASAFLVFRDNDWGKPQAAKLFRQAVARMRNFGKPVESVSMPADWGKDVNDAINS